MLSLTAMEALKEAGYRVRLVTTVPTKWSLVERVTGKRVRPDEESVVFPFQFNVFGIYTRLLTFLRLLRDRDCDVTFNTHGDVLPVATDITYIHFPTFAMFANNPVNFKYTQSVFWRVYATPYFLVQKLLTHRLSNSLVLTNSNYSKEAIRKHLGLESHVVYPPVNTSLFHRVAGNRRREDVVVSCGRYTPEKNYDLVLNVAKRLRDLQFIIIGADSGKITGRYYNHLVRRLRNEGISNVLLLRNVSREEQIDLYSRAKVFLHSMIGEHFGIAVVEAMASGLVPVVHRSGGPWMDIVEYGRHGYGFNDLDDAVDAVRRAVENYHVLKDNVTKRSLFFDENKFKHRVRLVVERVLDEKLS